jgi:serine/threonine protein phosphatase PrpC
MESASGGEELRTPPGETEAGAPPPSPVEPEPKRPISRFFSFFAGKRAEADPPAAPATPAPAERPVEKAAPSSQSSDLHAPASFQNREAGDWTPDPLQSHLSEDLQALDYDDNYECERNGCNGWKVLGATRRGRMHAHHGTHREDAFDFACGPHFSILCVSDGAGSYQHSRVGAEMAVRIVRRELEGFFQRQSSALEILARPALVQIVGTAMGEAVKAAMEEIIALAGRAGCQPRDFRCTLLLTVLYTGPNASLLLASQIGDGFIATLDRSGLTQRQVTADSDSAGDFGGQVKCFLPDAEALPLAYRFKPLDPEKLEAVLLATDGIEDPFFPIARHGATIFRQFYDGVAETLPGFKQQAIHGPILGQARAKKRIHNWMKFEKRGENDDRTVLILHREPTRAPVEIRPAEPVPSELERDADA